MLEIQTLLREKLPSGWRPFLDRFDHERSGIHIPLMLLLPCKVSLGLSRSHVSMAKIGVVQSPEYEYKLVYGGFANFCEPRLLESFITMLAMNHGNALTGNHRDQYMAIVEGCDELVSMSTYYRAVAFNDPILGIVYYPNLEFNNIPKDAIFIVEPTDHDGDALSLSTYNWQLSSLFPVASSIQLIKDKLVDCSLTPNYWGSFANLSTYLTWISIHGVDENFIDFSNAVISNFIYSDQFEYAELVLIFGYRFEFAPPIDHYTSILELMLRFPLTGKTTCPSSMIKAKTFANKYPMLPPTLELIQPNQEFGSMTLLDFCSLNYKGSNYNEFRSQSFFESYYTYLTQWWDHSRFVPVYGPELSSADEKKLSDSCTRLVIPDSCSLLSLKPCWVKECVICLEPEKSPGYMYPCGHSFHADCAHSLLETTDRCCLCRQFIMVQYTNLLCIKHLPRYNYDLKNSVLYVTRLVCDILKMELDFPGQAPIVLPHVISKVSASYFDSLMNFYYLGLDGSKFSTQNKQLLLPYMILLFFYQYGIDDFEYAFCGKPFSHNLMVYNPFLRKFRKYAKCIGGSNFVLMGFLNWMIHGLWMLMPFRRPRNGRYKRDIDLMKFCPSFCRSTKFVPFVWPFNSDVIVR